MGSGRDGTLCRKLQRKLVIRTIAAFLLLFLSLAYFLLLNGEGLLTVAGFFTAYEANGSLARMDNIAKRRSWDLFRVSLTVPRAKIMDAGVQSAWGNMPVAQYLAVQMDGTFVLCPVSLETRTEIARSERYTFTGSLQRAEPELLSLVTGNLVKRGYSKEEATAAIYPFILSPENPMLATRLMMYLLFVALLTFTVAVFIRRLVPVLDMHRYSGFRHLPYRLSAQEAFPAIERQYAGAGEGCFHALGCGNKIALLPNWIIHESRWNIRFYLADDLLWAFLAEGGARLSDGRLPGRGNWLCLYFRNCSMKCPGRESRLEGLLHSVQQAYPWALTGYTRERDAMWDHDIKKLADNADHTKQKIGFTGLT